MTEDALTLSRATPSRYEALRPFERRLADKRLTYWLDRLNRRYPQADDQNKREAIWHAYQDAAITIVRFYGLILAVGLGTIVRAPRIWAIVVGVIGIAIGAPGTGIGFWRAQHLKAYLKTAEG